jgi:hypothetical protein
MHWQLQVALLIWSNTAAASPLQSYSSHRTELSCVNKLFLKGTTGAGQGHISADALIEVAVQGAMVTLLTHPDTPKAAGAPCRSLMMRAFLHFARAAQRCQGKQCPRVQSGATNHGVRNLWPAGRARAAFQQGDTGYIL